MPAPRHMEAAVAVVFMDRMMVAPALHRPSVDTREPVRGTELRVRACTARERVEQHISEFGSYNNRHTEDIFITPKALARVLECSEQTARRRLKFLEEQGIVFLAADGGSQRLYYQLASKFRPETDEYVPTQTEIVDTTKKLFEALEED